MPRQECQDCLDKRNTAQRALAEIEDLESRLDSDDPDFSIHILDIHMTLDELKDILKEV